jgi:uncharacterized membrane protein YoaK (UPF0700 family)
MAFMALGHVFAGVMTGNLALLGIALGGGRSADVVAPLVALAGFVAGTAASARLCRGARGRSGGTVPRWPGRTTAALACEGVLLAAAAVAWALGGTPPSGAARDVLLCAAAVAMGIQSGAMLGAGTAARPSTYLTGSLATFVTRGVGRLPGDGRPGTDGWVPVRLAALAGGAGAAAAVFRFAPSWTAALPPALVAAALLTAGGGPRREPASDA